MIILTKLILVGCRTCIMCKRHKKYDLSLTPLVTTSSYHVLRSHIKNYNESHLDWKSAITWFVQCQTEILECMGEKGNNGECNKSQCLPHWSHDLHPGPSGV